MSISDMPHMPLNPINQGLVLDIYTEQKNIKLKCYRLKHFSSFSWKQFIVASKQYFKSSQTRLNSKGLIQAKILGNPRSQIPWDLEQLTDRKKPKSLFIGQQCAATT